MKLKIFQRGGIMFYSFMPDRKKLLLITVILMILVLGGIYFILPKVTVEISPTIREVTDTVKLSIDLETSELSEESGVIPAERKEEEVTASIVLSTTGEKLVGIEPAAGDVVLLNREEEEVVLPAGTILERTDGFKYRTLEETIINPKKFEYIGTLVVSSELGRAAVRIEAVDKGREGNLEAEQILELPEFKEDLLAVNLENIGGGKDQIFNIVSESDLEEGKDLLLSEVQKIMVEKLQSNISEQKLLLASTVEPLSIDYNFDYAKGEEAEQLKGEAAAVVGGFSILKDNLQKVIADSFLENIPSGYELYGSKLNIETLAVERYNEQTAQLKLKTKGEAVASINLQQLASRLRGVSAYEAEEILADLSGIDSYQVNAGSEENMPRFSHWINIQVPKLER